MTPGVVVCLILAGAAVICTAIAGVVYLQSIGRDPEPMLKLAAQIATGIGSMGTLLVTLTNRATVAKVEANTGTLPERVLQAVEDALYEPAPPPGAHTPADAPATLYGAQSRPPVPR